jgi:1-acylglycerone phosphate reductase
MSKRVAVITGCSEPNSLGAAFARELLNRNWTVFATARNESTLSQLREAGCHTLRLDVCSKESVSQASQEIATLTGGRLDLLINNVSVICPVQKAES